MHSIEARQDILTELYLSYKPQKVKARTTPSMQTASVSLDDRMLLDIATHAKNGAKFSALWQGSSAGYSSQSEADQALCCILAFYTGDNPGRIDSLFRQSGLYREDRWDAPARTGETYGQGTITRAIEGLTAVYGQSAREDDMYQARAGDAEQIIAYRYALSLTDERIDDLSHDELKQACKEMSTLLNGLLSLTYAKGAKPTTRLAGQDLLITSAKRTMRGLSASVTDAMPVCISNDEYGVAARLGMGRNSVSSAYNAYEQAGLLNRSYRESEDGEVQHLDIALDPTFLIKGNTVQDKKAYPARTTSPFKGVEVEAHCTNCGSENISVICRDCGNLQELGDTPTMETISEETAETKEQEDPCTNFVQSYSACGLEDCTKFVQEQVTEEHKPADEPFQVDESIQYGGDRLIIFKVMPHCILAERAKNKSVVKIEPSDYSRIKRKHRRAS